MTDYIAPLQDMNFALNELAGLNTTNKLPGLEEATPILSKPYSKKPDD